MNKIYRSNTDKWLTGVIGGLAAHYKVNSIGLRVVVLVVALFVPLGVLLVIPYIIMAIKLPVMTDVVVDDCDNADVEKKKAGPALDIESILKGIERYAGTEDEALLLSMAGEAYFKGIYGATKDYDKAIYYYKKYEQLDPVDGAFCVGSTLISKGIEMDIKDCFSTGVFKLYNAYKGGSLKAEESLQQIAEKGMFNNVSTLDELIAFIEMHSKR